MISFFAWSRPVIQLIWLLVNRDRGNWTVVVVLCAWSQSNSVFLEKKSDKTINKLRWMSLEALIWGLSGPNKLATIIKSYFNKKHQTTFFNRFCFLTAITPVRSIWNLLFRSERKIVLWQKISGPQFCYSSSLLALVEVPFFKRKILEGIGSPRKVILYEFHHKHGISQKNVILSPQKTHDHLYRVI